MQEKEAHLVLLPQLKDFDSVFFNSLPDSLNAQRWLVLCVN